MCVCVKIVKCSPAPESHTVGYSKVQHFYERIHIVVFFVCLFVFQFLVNFLFHETFQWKKKNYVNLFCCFFFKFSDKRFTPNNTTTTTTTSVSSSPISEKRSTITVTKKSSNKQHVNQAIIVPPVANSTLHAKGRWSQSNTFHVVVTVAVAVDTVCHPEFICRFANISLAFCSLFLRRMLCVCVFVCN